MTHFGHFNLNTRRAPDPEPELEQREPEAAEFVVRIDGETSVRYERTAHELVATLVSHGEPILGADGRPLGVRMRAEQDPRGGLRLRTLDGRTLDQQRALRALLLFRAWSDMGVSS